MLFDDDEWPRCPDHGELKAWKKRPPWGLAAVCQQSLYVPTAGMIGQPGTQDKVPELS